MKDTLTNKAQVESSEAEARRQFLKKIGKSSVAVPAAALLLAASQEKAQATTSGQGSGSS